MPNTTISTHRFVQLHNLLDTCEADARLNWRCARAADSIGNRSAAAFFRARATKATRIATLVALRMEL